MHLRTGFCGGNGRRRFLPLHAGLWLAGCIAALFLTMGALGQAPAIGARVPDFTLNTPMGGTVHLAEETRHGTVVLVLLRGYPGYQCPFCVRQVHDFADHAAAFAARKVEILFVYPGPPAALDDHAKEFLAKQSELPGNIKLVIDPDYRMTNQYGLRWDAPRETAYPATFVLDGQGKVVFEKVSREHGGRTSAEEILAELAGK